MVTSKPRSSKNARWETVNARSSVKIKFVACASPSRAFQLCFAEPELQPHFFSPVWLVIPQEGCLCVLSSQESCMLAVLRLNWRGKGGVQSVDFFLASANGILYLCNFSHRWVCVAQQWHWGLFAHYHREFALFPCILELQLAPVP